MPSLLCTSRNTRAYFFLYPHASAIWFNSPCSYKLDIVGFFTFLVWWEDLNGHFPPEWTIELLYSLFLLLFRTYGRHIIKKSLILFSKSFLLLHLIVLLAMQSFSSMVFFLHLHHANLYVNYIKWFGYLLLIEP